MTTVTIHRDFSIDADGADEVMFSMSLPNALAPMAGGNMTFGLEYLGVSASAQRRGRAAPRNPQTDFMVVGGGSSGQPLVEWFASGTQRHFAGVMRVRFEWRDASGVAQFAEAQFDAGNRVNSSQKVLLNALPGTELSVCAEYPMPWDGNATAEIAAANTGRWHPGTVSFRTIAATPNRGANRTLLRSASDVDTLMGAILSQPDNSIRRLNIFTHGGSGLVSLRGNLDVTTNQVMMEPRANDANNNPIAGGLDTTVVDWYNTNPVGITFRSQIRSKFRADAEILLFLCSGGVGTGALLAINLGRCFNVAVLAYTDPIGYYVEFAGSNIDRNLTSRGLVPDSQYTQARGSGTIGPGYPCAVVVPSPVPNGSHMTPFDTILPRPPTPAP